MQGGHFSDDTRTLYVIEGMEAIPANDNDDVPATNVTPLHCGYGGCSERFMSVYRLLFPEYFATDVPPMVS